MSKRSRDSVTQEAEITFIIGNIKNGNQLGYTQRIFGKDTRFDQGAASITYGLYLNELLQTHALNYALYVLHKGTVIFSTMLVPDKQTKQIVNLIDRRYLVFETHQVITERSDAPLTIFGLFIQLINTDTSDNLSSPCICPVVDMSLTWFEQTMGKERYKDTEFFPYDIDPEKYNLKVDFRRIPQRTPLWFKARGELTGTKAYKVLGFYVPTKEADPGWTLDGGETKPIDNFQRSRMRFGSLVEEGAAVLYMLTRPHVRLEMVGFCKTPLDMKLPSSWGCSPDGLIYDPSMSPAKIPESIWNLLSIAEKGWDVRNGVLEIKSSKNSLKFNAYYLPQIYMEMISTKTIWCDLVRYTRKRITDVHGKWITKHVARIYRVFRHKPVQEKMIELWKYGLKHKKRLQDVVHSDQAFIQFRKYLSDVADKFAYTEISSTSDMMPVFESYNQFQAQFYVASRVPLHKKLLGAVPAHKINKVVPDNDDGDVSRLKRAKLMVDKMEGLKQKKLIQSLTSQIRFYSEWLDEESFCL